MAPPVSSLFKIGADILGSIVDAATSLIKVQLGDVGVEQADSQDAEWWQHVGFCSLPSTASPQKAAAQTIAIVRSDRDACVASRDQRGAALIANLKPGETCLYAGGADGNAQGRVLLKQDGSITLYTTKDNTSNGQGCYLRMGGDGFRIETPYGRLVMDATGIHLVHASGGRFDLGGIGGLPAPFGSLSSYASIEASILKCAGGQTFLGKGPYANVCGTASNIPFTPAASLPAVCASGTVYTTVL